MSSRQMIIFAIMAIVFVALMAWRMRRMMTATPFNPYRAWMLPAIFLAFTGLAFVGAWPLSVMEWLWVVLAAIVGGGLGWMRGKSITMTYDATTKQVFAQGGAMAMLFIVALIVVRTGLNFYLHANTGSLHLRAVEADVIFATLGTGLFIARSVEMGIRGHKLIVANQGLVAAPVVDVP